MPSSVVIYKKVGETPLEALERFRAEQIVLDDKNSSEWKTVPMTYAGRLDPLAEGKLIILIGDECKNKEKYLGLDKEYEVEVLFGIETDTYDVLGLVTGETGATHSFCDTDIFLLKNSSSSRQSRSLGHKKNVLRPFPHNIKKYIGTFTQSYPPYSSKTVNGKQLHELARIDELPEEMPTKQVEIYSIECIGTSLRISAHQLKSRVLAAIGKVKGDFRQKEIIEQWEKVLGHTERTFEVCNLRVRCSSGTYMRSLAHQMGQDIGCGALALSIKRTKIGV